MAHKRPVLTPLAWSLSEQTALVQKVFSMITGRKVVDLTPYLKDSEDPKTTKAFPSKMPLHLINWDEVSRDLKFRTPDACKVHFKLLMSRATGLERKHFKYTDQERRLKMMWALQKQRAFVTGGDKISMAQMTRFVGDGISSKRCYQKMSDLSQEN
ncbi:hypothetical protein MP638_005492 [Amoeboaphelidium occidentale]|nr:hypothetical protein MP638_005492 [Amoeboaphelidium occidentale]